MRLCDLHCDTLTELDNRGGNFAENDLQISLRRAAAFDSYVQVLAVWCDKELSDEASFERFCRIADSFLAWADGRSDFVLCRTGSEVNAAVCAGKRAAVLAVEDARLLCGHIELLDVLREKGVRFLTLQWAGETATGGAWNTHSGLTDFGRAVVKRCFEIGIVPDLSHASLEVTDEVLSMAEECGLPVVCTHSDSYALTPNGRNITDETYRRIAALGGIVGVCLCPGHLSDKNSASSDDAAAHMLRGLSIEPDAVALGCDFDGIGDDTPVDLPDVSALSLLYEKVRKAVGNELADKAFFGNVFRFLTTYLR